MTDEIKTIREIPEKCLKSFNKDFDFGEAATPGEAIVFGALWVAIGVILIEANLKAVPWTVPLGWIMMICGAITSVVGGAIISALKHKKK